MIAVAGLRELVDRFDAFLVDQFGVLIDGAQLYPDALAGLQALRDAGKPALLVSNSGKRGAANLARLARLGVARDLFLDVLTSGEVAHAAMAARIGRELPRGARVWVETTDDSANPLDGLDLTRVDDPREADLIWIAGARPWARTLEDYADLLRAPAARGVPAICSNPDITMLIREGRVFGAGRIAALYETLGGTVEGFGKPHPAIYCAALDRLGNPDPVRVLAIGDSPAHDILGGARAGLATALVRTGIHAGESEAEIAARCAALGIAADYLLPSFAV